MAYVEVDIDLDEFETHELVYELSRRINKAGRKKLSPKDKAEIASEIKDFLAELGEDAITLPVKTLDDKMKVDHLSKVWNKYTSSDIERMLPE